MKMIIQRLLAISAVIVLSIVLNYATTQDIINAEAAQIGFQVLLLIYLIQLVDSEGASKTLRLVKE